ncbi:MAG: thioredoxin family protein [bacterium]
MSATPYTEINDVGSLRARYLAAQDFSSMLRDVQKNAELWAAVWRRAHVPQQYLDRVAALGRPWHLLALSEDWCGDAVNTLPVIAKLAELSPLVDLRVLARDSNDDLMAAHLTGLSRSIPVVMALDDQYVERGWWGPRPSELQQWVLGPGQAMDKVARYRDVRAWYARDHGTTALDELLRVLERAAR